MGKLYWSTLLAVPHTDAIPSETEAAKARASRSHREDMQLLLSGHLAYSQQRDAHLKNDHCREHHGMFPNVTNLTFSLSLAVIFTAHASSSSAGGFNYEVHYG